MSELVTIAYPHIDNAVQARDRLLSLQREHSVQLADLALVERQGNGRITVHPTHHRASTYAAEGAVAGGLLGLVAFGPIIGLALAAAGFASAAAGATVLGAGTTALAGAGVGAAVKEADDNSLDIGFVKELGEHLPAGGAALFLLLTADIDKVVAAIAPYGGHVIRTTLSAAEEQRVQTAIATARSSGQGDPSA
ncbi:DUF1269 domain-containing protein [Streptosporangium carneum]|uniref:DUF1269 domain-containing protein n=1 Tax=Streptosporangium carneum TaxID=47481 RepID=A0A9W6MHD1_9ACTN|nr:DUF1269 domain-containing protein [Streptosporangium carneum]GLK14111.1 hypothetical protein GCM10017600_75230 [Streptosporangium carneum]